MFNWQQQHSSAPRVPQESGHKSLQLPVVKAWASIQFERLVKWNDTPHVWHTRLIKTHNSNITSRIRPLNPTFRFDSSLSWSSLKGQNITGGNPRLLGITEEPQTCVEYEATLGFHKHGGPMLFQRQAGSTGCCPQSNGSDACLKHRLRRRKLKESWLATCRHCFYSSLNSWHARYTIQHRNIT